MGNQSKKLISFNSIAEPRLRLNSICPYFTMFPVDFPYEKLKRGKSNHWVLDPFCGRGTTLYAARLHGISCIGIDSNPVALAIAESKLANVKAGDLTSLCENILNQRLPGIQSPRGDFWDRCFEGDTLRKIAKLRAYFLKSCSSQEEKALRALILGILHGPVSKVEPSYLSNQMPRTYSTKPDAALRYWKKKRLFPEHVDVFELVKRRAEYTFKEVPNRVEGRVICGDARNGSLFRKGKRVFKHIVTSPPYFGMRTYLPDQWLRLWFLGGASAPDYLQEKQIQTISKDQFATELGRVWKNSASMCEKGAHLHIRFGALPSAKVSPRQIIKKSLLASDAGWEVLSVDGAGLPPNQRRQATQFERKLGQAIEEIDVHAVLTR